jgi:murein DD-endopeptidase MepM/ murein hydrolase activator NlpD
MPFTYTVKAGDTLWDLSIEFDTNVDSIIGANLALEEYPDTLLIGQPILIPPLVGAVHIVAPGDTLSDIAATYRATVDSIVNYAGNAQKIDGPLPVGKMLLIPGGIKPAVQRWVSTEKGELAVNIPAEKGMLAWPASGLITSWFSRTHLAIDIANGAGSPVRAAANGVVIFAGEKGGGFGNTVMIDHGDGYSTLCAHFQAISVAVGQTVTQGEPLGEMGCTGTCTGPHVHFALYYLGGAVNPLHYLP